jgi:hypothetical protein
VFAAKTIENKDPVNTSDENSVGSSVNLPNPAAIHATPDPSKMSSQKATQSSMLMIHHY